MNTPHPLISVVIIGRNEGNRLLRCIDSVHQAAARGHRIETIYVDSNSSDGSVEQARARGARVLQVRPERPCAAMGRNAGWRAALGHWILFLDGDTVLAPDFIEKALAQMEDPRIGVVWGHRRELAPEASIYNRVLDFDWIYPAGESAFCGGDALMRRDVLMAVGGFDDTLIAGEEPELCRRIRARGFSIMHIDTLMTHHDLAIKDFSSYWRRAFRAGHAYAEISHRFADTTDPLWIHESRRNLMHATALSLFPILLLMSLAQPFIFGALLLAGFALIGRTTARCAWKNGAWRHRLLYALHSHLQQIPIALGQLAWHRDRQRGERRALIEYKH